MKNELVSVIVPVYNVAPYIEKCILSILDQEYENIELLLIDDGSPDESGAICDRMARSDHRIKVIHQENAGVSAARNKGVECASGYYICFVDGDDYIDRDMLSYLVRIIEETESDIARCSAREVGMGIAPATEHSDDEYGVYSIEESLKNIYTVKDNFSTTSCHILFKKSVICDIRFGSARFYEDMEYITKAVLNCQRLVSSRAAKYNYLHRSDSSHSYSLKVKIDNIKQVWINVRKELQDKNSSLLPYADVRYVKNVLEQLYKDAYTCGIKNDEYAASVIKDIRKLKIRRSELNKTEKSLYMLLTFGAGGFETGAKLIYKMKKRRGR